MNNTPPNYGDQSALTYPSANEQNKTIIMDHLVTENHVVDWDNYKIIDSESGNLK